MTDNEHTETPQFEQELPRAPKKGGGALALLIALIALGSSGYLLYRDYQRGHTPNPQAGQLAALSAQVAKLNPQTPGDNAVKIAALQGQIAKLQGEVRALGGRVGLNAPQSAVEGLRQALNAAVQKLTVERNAALAALPRGLDEARVNTLIKSALVDFRAHGGSNVHLDAEMAQIAKSRAEIEGYAQQLHAVMAGAQAQIQQSLAAAQKTLAQAAQQPLVAPLLNLLALADFAARTGQYQRAEQLLAQAQAALPALHLDPALAPKIAALRKVAAQNASREPFALGVEQALASLPHWAFITPSFEKLLTTDKPQEASWLKSLRNVSRKVVNNTVQVAKKDEAGLVWIHQNPFLQAAVREGVRLDLDLLRAQLQAGAWAQATQQAKATAAEIQSHFDGKTPEVQQALALLKRLAQTPAPAPLNIGALVATLPH